MQYGLIGCFAWLAAAGTLNASPGTAALFAERARTLVYIEYYVQHEIDRQAMQGVGLVVNDSGLVVTLPTVFQEWIPINRFRDIRLYPANNPNGKGFLAEYLGQDPVSGWQVLQITDEAALAYLTPITVFGWGEPEIGDGIWGVCMTSSELDYIPYFRDGRLSAKHRLPLMTGFSTHELAVPGGPVFLDDGRFAGWAYQALPRERDLWIGNDYFRANIRHPDESFVFLLAEPFLADLERMLATRAYAQRPGWIGVVGAEALDKETAAFLGLENQGAIVISEVLPDSPAQAGGLAERDIVVAMNGELLPRLRPDSVLQLFFEREILAVGAGGQLQMTVLRGDEKVDLRIEPAPAPQRLSEAARTYYDRIGLGIREVVLNDSIQWRRDHREARGVIVSFIRNNSAAAAGGLRVNDWILEIGGTEIAGIADGMARMEELLNEPSQEEVVLLTLRRNETSVIRIKKN